MNYKNPGKITFSAKMIDAGGGGVFVECPFNVYDLFGVKGRVPIKATFDNKIDYIGSIVKMGTGSHVLIVLKQIREALGKGPGDNTDVELWLDSSERQVEIPNDVKEALQKDLQLFDYFKQLSFTHQKEYIQWIEEAKKSETRTNRIVKMIKMLKEAYGNKK
ncbi:MAG: hypothetical protein Fur003_4940 [Candidatus Dojkabacteria bacterium]